MKKTHVFLLSILFIFTMLVSSCKKKEDPAPDGAPKLNDGVGTELTVFRGYTAIWDLSGKVTDPQGDTWSVTSVSSSNTNIVSVAINPVKGGALPQSISFSGEDVNGTATITVVVTDSTGASRSITATITVSTNYIPPVIPGVPAASM